MSDRITKADLPGRIRRLQELAGKLSVEMLRVYQQRSPLKPDEIWAYGGGLFQAFAGLEEARAALETALDRMK